VCSFGRSERKKGPAAYSPEGTPPYGDSSARGSIVWILYRLFSLFSSIVFDFFPAFFQRSVPVRTFVLGANTRLLIGAWHPFVPAPLVVESPSAK
jgi:hypothetical protein